MVKEFNRDGETDRYSDAGRNFIAAMLRDEKSSSGGYFPFSPFRPSDQQPQYHLARYYSSFYLRIGEGDEHSLIDTTVVLRNLGGKTTSSKIPQETCYASFYPVKPCYLSTRASRHCTVLKETKQPQKKRAKGNVNSLFLHIISHIRK
jgi:hypothetical protein